MNTNFLYIIIYILIIINIMSFIIAYILYVFSTKGVIKIDNYSSRNIINKVVNDEILIDEKKFVTEIKTDLLEKKYEDFGQVTKSNENISSSINKLKNMKG